MESVWWLLQIYKQKIYYTKGIQSKPYLQAGTGLSSRQSKTKPGSYRDVTDTTVVRTTGIVNL
jgi:isoleucyl-tRNA synthetase